MTATKIAAALTAGALALSSTGAYAGEVTRSAGSIPALKAMTAPISGIRASKSLKKKSDALQGAGLGLAILIGVGGTAAIIYATTNSGTPKSPG